jgi:outer membrane protein assembly factor BamB
LSVRAPKTYHALVGTKDETVPLSRRALLRTGGVALGGVLAGCQRDDSEQFPRRNRRPPPHRIRLRCRRRPTGRGSRPTRRTGGHLDGRAVTDSPETYWRFFVQASPPVVADGRTYTAEHGRERSLVARDAATGRVEWSRVVDRGGEFGVPTVAGETLVAQSYSLCFGFDRETGERRWELDVGRGPPGSPVVADGVAYLASGSFSDWPTVVVAVDTETGAERWRTDLGTGELHLRGSVAVADGLILVADGVSRWQFDLPRATTPTVDAEAVYAGQRGFEERSVVAVGRADGERRWRRDTEEVGISDTVQAGVYGPPTLVEGGVYVVAADGIRAFGR